jgi:uncharacterized membrane protein
MMSPLTGRLRLVSARDDAGQLLLLVLAYTVIAGLLVTAVVNLSRAYLYRRALLAAADGAALAAANEPDLRRVYAGTGSALPLSERGADAAVRRYATGADLAERFNGFQVVDVSTDGETVTVTLRAVVRLPFVNLLSDHLAEGYPVDATARARSPLTR